MKSWPETKKKTAGLKEARATQKMPTEEEEEAAELGDQLAAQEVGLADLQRQLDLARSEGERLKKESDAAIPLSKAEEARAVSGSGEEVSSAENVPSMADLFALAESQHASGPPRATCFVCEMDSYSLRSQLVPCSRCSRVAHARCVGLRQIPFRMSTTTDLRNRDLYIRRYYSDWKCAPCKKQQVASDLEEARATIARQAAQLDRIKLLVFSDDDDEACRSCSRCRLVREELLLEAH